MVSSVTKASVVSAIRSALEGNFLYVVDTVKVILGAATPPMLHVSTSSSRKKALTPCLTQKYLDSPEVTGRGR